MESFQSKLVKWLLKTINFKKRWQVTGEKLKKNMRKMQLSESNEPP